MQEAVRRSDSFARGRPSFGQLCEAFHHTQAMIVGQTAPLIPTTRWVVAILGCCIYILTRPLEFFLGSCRTLWHGPAFGKFTLLQSHCRMKMSFLPSSIDECLAPPIEGRTKLRTEVAQTNELGSGQLLFQYCGPENKWDLRHFINVNNALEDMKFAQTVV